MPDSSDIQRRLAEMKRERLGISSMLEMMEKGTSRKDLTKLKKEKLAPIEEEIKKLESQLSAGQ